MSTVLWEFKGCMGHPDRAGKYYPAEDDIGHCNIDFCHPPAISKSLWLRMLVPCAKIPIPFLTSTLPFSICVSNPCFSGFLFLKIAWLLSTTTWNQQFLSMSFTERSIQNLRVNNDLAGSMKMS